MMNVCFRQHRIYLFARPRQSLLLVSARFCIWYIIYSSELCIVQDRLTEEGGAGGWVGREGEGGGGVDITKRKMLTGETSRISETKSFATDAPKRSSLDQKHSKKLKRRWETS